MAARLCRLVAEEGSAFGKEEEEDLLAGTTEWLTLWLSIWQPHIDSRRSAALSRLFSLLNLPRKEGRSKVNTHVARNFPDAAEIQLLGKLV